MFVKIVRTTKVEDKMSSVESTYQCGSVSFRDVERKAVDKLTGEDISVNDLMIEMEGCPVAADGFLAHQCTKSGLGVYVMNDSGRTIDSYNFT